jgi:ribose-phosphate pyrophosphokinase
MLVIGCSHGKHLAKKVAKKLKKPYSELKVEKFPDGEMYVRFMKNVKNKDIVLIQSFYGNINDCLIEVLFAADTAKELGAKKIFLVAPYFAYLRQDKRFKPGECISCKVVGKSVDNVFDKVFIIDPHLHREITLDHIFKTKAVKLSSNAYTASYIKKNFKNPVIIGPDSESYKWAGKVASIIGCKSHIFKKKRHSGRKVKVTLNRDIDLDGKDIIIVDDICSTGSTLIEAIRCLKKLGAKKFTCIAVHGIFIENALKKLRKMNAKVITTNTVPNTVSKIDVSGLISNSLE